MKHEVIKLYKGSNLLIYVCLFLVQIYIGM